ncbi:MAG: MFS transporter [Gemmatimonadota bacterium]
MARLRGEPTVGSWAALTVVSAAVLLGMSVWFAASAVGPVLQARWGLGPVQAGWLTSLVQLGFVAGTLAAALSGVADVLDSRSYFAGSAVGAALANAMLLVVPGYEVALMSRFATGFFLAGVYPPAMKMTATWFVRNRGLAIGIVVGALTVGKALPYLVDAAGGVGPSSAAAGGVVAVTSAAAALGALLVLTAYRDGPHAFPRRRFSWELARAVVGSRSWRLATGGYLGHMWELYAMWTWIAAFLTASAAASGESGPWSEFAPFFVIAAGGAGCVWGGLVADRIGREDLTIRALGASGACAVAIGLLFGGPFPLVLALALAWGFFVVADSAQFSAAVTEVVPPHVVGTALTLQVSLGFLLTMATIQLTPVLADLVGWRWTFPVLALGPAAGIASMRRLRGRRASASPGVAPG